MRRNILVVVAALVAAFFVVGVWATGTVPVVPNQDCKGWVKVAGALYPNGGIACDTDKFTVANTTGNVGMAGTLSMSKVNAAGSGQTVFDYTGTLGIMDNSDTFKFLNVDITNANHTGTANYVYVMYIDGITGDAQAEEEALYIGSGWDYGLVTASPILSSANVTLDDGSGASPSLTFTDATDETAVLAKADSGNLSCTTVAGDGFQVLTGNLFVGNGTPDVTPDGEDAYIEGTLEVDGAVRFDGGVILGDASGDAITVTGTPTFATVSGITAGGGTAATGVAAAESFPAVKKLTLTFTLTGANDIDVADGGKTTGYKVFDFPEGRILIFGAVVNASITTNAAYNADANDIYYVGIGTADGTQAADADLTTTEQDVIPKTTIQTDTGGGANSILTSDWHSNMGTLAYANNEFDGTTTPAALYVNVAVPDASNTGATTHAITGTLTVTYANLGDY